MKKNSVCKENEKLNLISLRLYNKHLMLKAQAEAALCRSGVAEFKVIVSGYKEEVEHATNEKLRTAAKEKIPFFENLIIEFSDEALMFDIAADKHKEESLHATDW